MIPIPLAFVYLRGTVAFVKLDCGKQYIVTISCDLRVVKDPILSAALDDLLYYFNSYEVAPAQVFIHTLFIVFISVFSSDFVYLWYCSLRNMMILYLI